jgi:hypothetical protein
MLIRYPHPRLFRNGAVREGKGPFLPAAGFPPGKRICTERLAADFVFGKLR